jgi:hypothetical protein
MPTVDTEASVARVGWVRRTWEKIATVIAVIGLADLSGQLIKWAAAIHLVITKYAIVKAWLFGWLPFHIPPEWHDPIVLLLIFLSVTNMGVYRETGKTYIFYALKHGWNRIILLALWPLKVFNSRINHKYNRIVMKESMLYPQGYTAVLAIKLIVLLGFCAFMAFFADPIGRILIAMFVVTAVVTTAVQSGMSILLDGAFLAWRWLLVTAAIFGALVIVNQVYVLWLEPLAEH